MASFAYERCLTSGDDPAEVAAVFERRGEAWMAAALAQGDMLEMPEIDATLRLTELYGS